MFMDKALNYYHNLCTSNKWHIPKGRVSACWNCGGDNHGVDKCKKPRDNAKIASNQKKFMEERQKKTGPESPSKQSGGRKNSSGEYSREKWGAPKLNEPNIRMHNGVPHAFCNKKSNGNVCGWNTTHSSKFHSIAKNTPNWSIHELAKLSPKHPLVMAAKTSEPPSVNVNAKQASENHKAIDQAKNVLSSFERSVQSDEARSVIEGLRSALGLN